MCIRGGFRDQQGGGGGKDWYLFGLFLGDPSYDI